VAKDLHRKVFALVQCRLGGKAANVSVRQS